MKVYEDDILVNQLLPTDLVPNLEETFATI